MSGLLAAFLAEVAIITYRDIAGTKQNHTIAGLPLPADYAAAILFFGVLGMVPSSASPGAKTTASLLGWGIVIATYLNLMPGVASTSQTASTTPPSATVVGINNKGASSSV